MISLAHELFMSEHYPVTLINTGACHVLNITWPVKDLKWIKIGATGVLFYF